MKFIRKLYKSVPVSSFKNKINKICFDKKLFSIEIYNDLIIVFSFFKFIIAIYIRFFYRIYVFIYIFFSNLLYYIHN